MVKYRSLTWLIAAVVATFLLVSGCTSEPAASTSRETMRAPAGPSPSATAAAPIALLTVPTDLVGKTLGEAKARLAKLGFRHVVIAGGDVTDYDKVVSVSPAGNSIAPDAKVVVVGDAPARQTATATVTPETDSQASAPGCGQHAVSAGQFDPSCAEYQGYLDPGTVAGRAPTSGEEQHAWGCQQGYIPESEC